MLGSETKIPSLLAATDTSTNISLACPPDLYLAEHLTSSILGLVLSLNTVDLELHISGVSAPMTTASLSLHGPRYPTVLSYVRLTILYSSVMEMIWFWPLLSFISNASLLLGMA